MEIGKLAVQTGAWPLMEIDEGNFKLNVKPKELRPIAEYLKPQGRFRHLSEGQLEYAAERRPDGVERPPRAREERSLPRLLNTLFTFYKATSPIAKAVCLVFSAWTILPSATAIISSSRRSPHSFTVSITEEDWASVEVDYVLEPFDSLLRRCYLDDGGEG